MKKFLAILISGIMLVSCLAACTEQEDADPSFDYFASDLSEYIVLGQYKGLEIDMTPECSDEDVDDSITAVLTANATTNQITDRLTEIGDTVYINFAGYLDGVAFEGGTGDYLFVLGQGNFIDGFEEAIIGVMPKETITADLTFPDPYPNNPDLAGKPVVFEITVNYIEEKIYPEYNDEFVTKISNGEYTNTVDYSNYLRDSINEDLAKRQEEYKQSLLMEMVREGTEVKKYPESEYDANYEEFVSSYREYAEYYQMDLGEFVSLFYGISEEYFYESANDYAYDTIVSNLIVGGIAQAEGISIDDEYYKERVETLAVECEYDSTEEFVEYYGEEYLRFYMIQEKVMAFVEEHCVVID